MACDPNTARLNQLPCSVKMGGVLARIVACLWVWTLSLSRSRKAWKPDDQLTRELATLNEGRRNAVNRRTELANEIKSQLKLYFPVALKVLENDITTALAADLLVQWPTLAELQKLSKMKDHRETCHNGRFLER
jgi:hypothetical protein